jgi:AmmeMemoRadiSam system protein B
MQTRPAAVAGMFYPAQEAILRADIAQMLAAVHPSPQQALTPKALIVPHAGYVYSGPIAAAAYALLAPLHGQIRRVVLLGPAHRVALRGLALPSTTAFATPLGNVPVDAAAAAIALRLPQVQVSDLVHAQEHSLEVQLPFLQSVLDDFTLLPLVVGQATAHEVATVIDAFWGGAETLIVISSDLSHYHHYASAQALDAATADRVLALQPLTSHEQACGAAPLNGLLEVARRRHLQASQLDLRNSGDTAGERSRVVGYAAFAFSEPSEAQTNVQH